MMTSILTPVLVLVALTVVMAIAMGFVRLPTMRRMGLTAQDAKHTADLNVLPSPVRQVADNYKHLVEQPTAFYALVFYIHLAGHADALNIQLAWAYVALRIVHTVVQSTVNIVMVRFTLYLLGTLVLGAMVVREFMALMA
jgi:hypothetical protein